jgi:hypothetical protein
MSELDGDDSSLEERPSLPVCLNGVFLGCGRPFHQKERKGKNGNQSSAYVQHDVTSIVTITQRLHGRDQRCPIGDSVKVPKPENSMVEILLPTTGSVIMSPLIRSHSWHFPGEAVLLFCFISE